MYEGELARQVKNRTGIPYVTIEHSLTDLAKAESSRRRRDVYAAVLRSAYWWFGVNTRMAERMARIAGDDFSPAQVGEHVIRNGADITFFEDKPPVRQNHGLLVVSVGWLGERKGHKVLIRAMRQVR